MTLVDVRRGIVILAFFFLLSFLGLSLVLAYWMVVRATDLGTSQSNPRVIAAEATAIRGTIVAADGTILARTDPATRKRVYTTASLSNVIGYSSAQYGQADLERSFGDYLSGHDLGEPLLEIWRRLTHQPSVGADLQLTIVPSIQKAADTALGGRRGAIIVARPSDGAVLALVSKPNFDPNNVDADWQKLTTDPGQPLLDRATQGLYPPGSTFKIVTNAAALDAGIASPTSTFTCSGDWVIEGFHISCENPQIPPTITLETALALSSNATYARLAVQLGLQRLTAEAEKFGFDSPIPFDLPTVTSHVRRSSGPWNNVLLATTGFGQGEVQATPLQMALVIAAVANRGAIAEPYLVQRVRDPNGTVLYQRQPRTWRTALSQATAATSVQMLENVVQHGSGVRAQIPGVAIAGKTGTAQVSNTAVPDAWFVCFAPVDAPRVVVAVLMENAGEGADVAAPAAKSVLQAALAAG